MLYLLLGFITGFVFAILCFSRLVIGKLMRVQDEDGVYPFMELNDPDINKVFKKKFVILEVGNSQK